MLEEGAKPVKVKMQRYSPSQRDFLVKKFQAMEAAGLVRPGDVFAQWADKRVLGIVNNIRGLAKEPRFLFYLVARINIRLVPAMLRPGFIGRFCAFYAVFYMGFLMFTAVEGCTYCAEAVGVSERCDPWRALAA